MRLRLTLYRFPFRQMYSQSIRPMPRAIEQAERIVEQLAVTRENIQVLNEQLKQVSREQKLHVLTQFIMI